MNDDQNLMYYNLGVKDAYCGILALLREKGISETLNQIIANVVILEPENPHLEIVRKLVNTKCQMT